MFNYNIFKAIVLFYRCNPEGINCEYFQTWTLSNICSLLRDKNQIWSSLYGAFDPPMLCPIDKVNKSFIHLLLYIFIMLIKIATFYLV